MFLIIYYVKKNYLLCTCSQVVAALEYEYTFWAKPDNRTAVRQNLIDVSQLFFVPLILLSNQF